MFTLILSEVEVNTVLIALAELPYKAVGELIPKIRETAIAQQQVAAAADAEAAATAAVSRHVAAITEGVEGGT